jgi:hypothetical protein
MKVSRPAIEVAIIGAMPGGRSRCQGGLPPRRSH